VIPLSKTCRIGGNIDVWRIVLELGNISRVRVGASQ
jgi:hypothetical protein